LLGAIGYGVEVTQLGDISYDAEVGTCCACTNGRRGAELDAIDLGAELGCVHKARLAQSVERKALNLVVVGSSPTVGV
jgi:hypothetical protein